MKSDRIRFIEEMLSLLNTSPAILMEIDECILNSLANNIILQLQIKDKIDRKPIDRKLR